MKRIGFLFFFALTVWMLGEIATRIFLPPHPHEQGPDRTETHPYIRTEWVPGFERTYVIEGIAGQTGTMEFKINEFGFRSSSMKTAAKPGRTYRIFFLGGSTTEELFLPEEKTFPSLVEKKLSGALPGKRFECINGGISGYLAADTLSLLIYKVLYYEPDLVLVTLGANDLLYGTLPTYDPIRRPDYRKTIYDAYLEESPSKTLARFLKHSQFLKLIKRRLVNRLFPPAEEKYKNPFEQYEAFRRSRLTRPFTPIEQSKSLEDFLEHLREMIAVARTRGVRFILMTEPFVYQEKLDAAVNERLWMGWLGSVSHRPINLSPDFLAREMNRFDDAVRELARKEGVELIDLEREIPKDLVHFYDDVHLTPAGAERAGEVVSAYLATREPLSVSAPGS